MKAKNKNNNLLIGILIIVGLVFCSLLLINLVPTGNIIDGTSNKNSQETYTETCKEVQVPYDYIEEYSETVPYTEEECESQELVYKKETGTCLQRKDNFFSEDEPAKYDCTITNLDDEAGVFSITIGFNVGNERLEETQNKYIYPQSSETFIVEKDATIDSCYCYENSIPSKQVCKDVTKYKEVIKTRTVTRYKTEEQCE
ncbi:hypothetical protein M0R72_03715 [Candidatus Pacearchaeota archaeon]|nr:hypothetical protein [Candidatus Pacearchaeota archaeon]